MGLTSWKEAPLGKIMKSDVSLAKNYLTEDELHSLERIVSAYLDLAEDRARHHIPIQKSEAIKNGLRKGFQDGSSKMEKRKCYGYGLTRYIKL